VPQTPSILWDLTVRENLVTYLRIAGATKRDPSHASGEHAAWTVESLASRVELDVRFDVVAGRLSGGERRRLELARALCMHPGVLVCDEPFAGVDPKGAERLGALLRELAESGVSVILADHHVEEALRICTRAVLLLDGAMEAEGEPSAFVEHPLVRGRYLGTLQP
jgi:lipopolysaccharide export system ATP-binding protein